MEDGVTVVTGFEPTTGFSVTSAPNMTLDQLARYAQYPNTMISFTTGGSTTSEKAISSPDWLPNYCPACRR